MKSAMLILIAASCLMYAPLGFEEFETPKVIALSTFGCFAFFFVNWKEAAKDRVMQALLLFCASALASTLASVDWHMSVFGNAKCPMGLIAIVSLTTVYAAASGVFRDGSARKDAISLILGCSFLVAAYGIAQAFGFDFRTWNGTLKDGTYTRPMSTLGHPNFMANYLAMTLPLALYRADVCSTTIRKLGYRLLACVFVAAIFMSLSRGMILAATLSVGLYFKLTRIRLTRFLWFSAMAVGVSSLAYVTVPSFKRDATLRMSAIVSPGPARVEYPRGAVNVWRQFPWFGIGTDAFELGFRNQRSDNYWKIEPGGSPHRAHNDFLNVLATQGILGALSALALTVAVIMRARRARSKLAAACVASIAAFYVAGLTSFFIAATGTLFMLYLAILKNEETKSNETHHSQPVRVIGLRDLRGPANVRELFGDSHKVLPDKPA
jgi:O-antigen ligase